MRKYRDIGSIGSLQWLRKSNFLYIFLSWNILGVCVYQWFKQKKVDDDSKWKQMTAAQKYLTFMTKPDDEITVVQVQGISKVTKKTMTVEEYLVPKPPTGPADSVTSSPSSDS